MLPYLKERLDAALAATAAAASAESASAAASAASASPAGGDASDAGVAAGAKGATTFYYQHPPTLRLQPGPSERTVRRHHDGKLSPLPAAA